MISRVWHGWTNPPNGDAYEQLLRTTILPGIASRGIAGYRGAWLYRRDLPDGVEFMTTLLFESMDAVREFAGDEYDVAVIVPGARRLLMRFDERSAHYEVLLSPETLAPPPAGGTRAARAAPIGPSGGASTP